MAINCRPRAGFYRKKGEGSSKIGEGKLFMHPVRMKEGGKKLRTSFFCGLGGLELDRGEAKEKKKGPSLKKGS